MKSIVVWCASVAVMVLMIIVAVPKATTAFAAAGDLTGQAWSSNVGWIHFGNAGAPYGVKLAMSGTTRNLSGYAWSSNIGWVSFDTAATESCPSGNCQARVEWGANGGTAVQVKGWARACSVFASGCNGSLKAGGKDGLTLGGWDGFISLGDGNTSDSVNYGVRLNTTTGAATGYGWGSEVVGWVDFSGVKVDITNTPELCPDGITLTSSGPCPTLCPDGTPIPATGGCLPPPSTCPVTGCPQCPIGSACYCALYPAECPNNPQCPNGTPAPNGDVNQCTSGPTALCTNISNEVLANMTPPILTVQDLLANHYRIFSDGRCGCQAGYVLNAQFQCVKPVYQEQ